MNKLKYLHILLKTEEFDFIFIVETWLKQFHSDATILGGNDYCIFRYDRPVTRGGGVCVLCKSSLSSKILLIESNAPPTLNAEILAFDYYLTKTYSARFVCVYLPPVSAINVNTVQILLPILQKLTRIPDFFLVGDFNFSGVNWNSPELASKPSFLEFHKYLNSNNLSQLVNFSTLIYNLKNT